MPVKLSNKNHFKSLMGRVKHYRGTDLDIVDKYKQYLTLLRETGTRPTIISLFPTTTSRNINYFLDRNWELADARDEIRKIQGSRYLNIAVKNRAVEKMKKTLSMKSPEEIMDINRRKGNNFKDMEKFSKKFHISIDEAIIRYSERSERQKTTARDTLHRLGGYKKEWTCRCKEYWMKRGYSEQESVKIVGNLQDTRSVKSIVARYQVSDIEALQIQELVSDKCRETFYKRPEEERRNITLKRTKFFKRYSKASSNFFAKLLKKAQIPSDIKVYLDDNEYFIWDYSDNKSIRFYDFTIPALSIIIEYNGIIFHPRVKDTIFNTVENSVRVDTLKKRLATDNGFEILYFWEKIDNVEESLEKFSQIIKNKIEEIYEIG